MKLLVTMLLITFSNILQAQPVVKDWLAVTTNSHHFMDRHKGYNERNFGMGWERAWSPEFRTGLGFYENSFYRQTEYAFVAYTPLEILGVRIGGAAGLTSGYEEDLLTPLIGVFFTKEWKHAGVNLLVNPAAAAIQFKFNWWE